jgi:hypothetical protein
MPFNTYTTDNYIYTTDWDYGRVTSVTIGDTHIHREKLVNILDRIMDRSEYPYITAPVEYPYYEKDIDKIVNLLVLARLNGDL